MKRKTNSLGADLNPDELKDRTNITRIYLGSYCLFCTASDFLTSSSLFAGFSEEVQQLIDGGLDGGADTKEKLSEECWIEIERLLESAEDSDLSD